MRPNGRTLLAAAFVVAAASACGRGGGNAPKGPQPVGGRRRASASSGDRDVGRPRRADRARSGVDAELAAVGQRRGGVRQRGPARAPRANRREARRFDAPRDARTAAGAGPSDVGAAQLVHAAGARHRRAGVEHRRDRAAATRRRAQRHGDRRRRVSQRARHVPSGSEAARARLRRGDAVPGGARRVRASAAGAEHRARVGAPGDGRTALRADARRQGQPDSSAAGRDESRAARRARSRR